MKTTKFYILISYNSGQRKEVKKGGKTNTKIGITVSKNIMVDPYIGMETFESSTNHKSRCLIINGRSSRGKGIIVNPVSGNVKPFLNHIPGENIYCFLIHKNCGLFACSHKIYHVNFTTKKKTVVPGTFKKHANEESRLELC